MWQVSGGSFSGDAAIKFGTKLSWSVCSVILGVSVLLFPFSASAVWACVSGVLFGALYTVLCGLTIELGRESWPEAVGVLRVSCLQRLLWGRLLVRW